MRFARSTPRRSKNLRSVSPSTSAGSPRSPAYLTTATAGYAVTVTLDPEMTRGYQGREDLDFIARIVGDDVRHHIATSKFVQDVDNLRREQYERDRSRWTLP